MSSIRNLSAIFFQSFQPKSFWMPRDAGCLTDGDMGYENSPRIEPKRGQWFMDAHGPELFNNKKQAMEAVNGRPVSGVTHMNVSPWDNASGFQSVPGQFSDRLFGSEPVRTVNLVDRNIPSIGSGNMNIGRKDFENQYGNHPSVGLSISHTLEDPSSCINFGGIRKVKVNQVRESDSVMSASMGNSYSRGDNGTISMGTTFNKTDDNTISLGPTYNNGEENTISMGPPFSKADDNFISVGHSHTFNKGDGNFILMGHNYSKSDNSILSVGQSYDKGDGNFISMGQSYEKGDGNTSYNKGHENFISIGATFSKANENFISMAPSYVKGNDNLMSMGPTYDKANSNCVPMGSNYDKGEAGNLSMGQSYNKGESNTISFGGYHDESEANPSTGIINSYDLLMSNQNSTQLLGVSGQKDSVESNVDPNSIPRASSKPENVAKNKEPKNAKKAPPNNFPSNVKSLLSTGMFDGVPVKYVSWSREVSPFFISLLSPFYLDM